MTLGLPSLPRFTYSLEETQLDIYAGTNNNAWQRFYRVRTILVYPSATIPFE